MKKLLLISAILLVSCSKSDILYEMPQMESKDTTYTPRTKHPKDTTRRIPIKFDVHITDWEDYDI